MTLIRPYIHESKTLKIKAFSGIKVDDKSLTWLKLVNVSKLYITNGQFENIYISEY